MVGSRICSPQNHLPTPHLLAAAAGGGRGTTTEAHMLGTTAAQPTSRRGGLSTPRTRHGFGCGVDKMNRLRLAIPSASKNVSRCGKLAICRAQSEDSKGGGGFLTGFLIGGAIFGTLGYVFAPQISKTLDSLLDENGQDSESDEHGLVKPRYGRYYDEGLEKTRQTLGDKISQLNLAIDKAASRLKRVAGNVEKEAINDESEIEISSFNDNELVAENLNEQGFVQGETAT
ncbi:uncharacterized protein LOC127756991 [Oryza glaberrima]|uniref:uncharacterized protein LOC127756991 n=1 Tax=Oryza glaberrima TaxID=4538 RepID=UPI00224C49DB|nr:uncharacterized protein LOC127756991 [Oryza glaberrima]